MGLIAAAVSLVGCSESGEDYCDTIAEEQKTLTELAESSSSGDDVLSPTLESFERLQDAAPEELEDEWGTVVNAYEALVDAVEEAGIDPADYQPDDPPRGLSEEEVDRIGAVASKVASARVAEAVDGIEEHSDEVCGVKFTG